MSRGRPAKPDYVNSEWAEKMVLLDKEVDRPGKGRPAKPKSDHRQSITIRLPPDLYAQLQELPRNMKGQWIEDAIRRKMVDMNQNK